MSQQPEMEAFVERLYQGVADRAMLTAMEQGFPIGEGMEKAARFFADAFIHHLNELAERYDQKNLLGLLYANLRDAMAKDSGRQ